MKKCLVLFILVVALVFIATALANTGSLTLSSDSPQVGDTLSFSGCGFEPNSIENVVVNYPGRFNGSIQLVNNTTDSNGCFTTDTFTLYESGGYKAYAWHTTMFDVDAKDFFQVH